MPEYEVQVTETPGMESGDRPAMRRMIDEGLLDMECLAELSRDELVAGLKILTDDYAAWIAEERDRIGKTLVGYDSPATEAMERCALILERLQEGIHTLATNDQALAAFQFANRAMASQRVHSTYTLAKRRGHGDLSSWPSYYFPFPHWPTRHIKTALNRWKHSLICFGSPQAAVKRKPIWGWPPSPWAFAASRGTWAAWMVAVVLQSSCVIPYVF